jgi:hypothetical protein
MGIFLASKLTASIERAKKQEFHGAKAKVKSFLQADVNRESERGETSEAVATKYVHNVCVGKDMM